MKELKEQDLTKLVLGFFVIVLIATAIGMAQNELTNSSGGSTPLAVRLQAGEADPTHVMRDLSAGVARVEVATVKEPPKSPKEMFDIPEILKEKAWISAGEPEIFFADEGMTHFGSAKDELWLRAAEFYGRSGSFRCYIVDDEDLAIRVPVAKSEIGIVADISEIEPGYYYVDGMSAVVEIR